MSNTQAVIKVADQIMARIFDQRLFTSGEIGYMVKEFGHDKVNLEQNFEKILKLNEDACVIADTNLEDLCESSEILARKHSDNVGSKIIEIAERLLNSEAEFQKEEAKFMANIRRLQTVRCQKYQNELEENLTKLTESLRVEELELERKYLQFELNLLKTKKENNK